ncbi:EC1118_1K5_1233p [Saccharomyces cerevisiae EC1118]|uniref:EC1118_1K5_1233p n=1 Tax=Saccharomyces cerevisiae (strain Lalvin EC1118 / Prise de mousse) TaxID=643680 RepID=C8ZC64_YEAS8|nr:EC1118_1K5_1233p [Saccharomyces cerevisiae EC1118]
MRKIARLLNWVSIDLLILVECFHQKGLLHHRLSLLVQQHLLHRDEVGYDGYYDDLCSYYTAILHPRPPLHRLRHHHYSGVDSLPLSNAMTVTLTVPPLHVVVCRLHSSLPV